MTGPSVVAQRDLARDVAVRLEQENARMEADCARLELEVAGLRAQLAELEGDKS